MALYTKPNSCKTGLVIFVFYCNFNSYTLPFYRCCIFLQWGWRSHTSHLDLITNNSDRPRNEALIALLKFPSGPYLLRFSQSHWSSDSITVTQVSTLTFESVFPIFVSANIRINSWFIGIDYLISVWFRVIDSPKSFMNIGWCVNVLWSKSNVGL